MNKLHIWIGTFDGNSQSFSDFFNLKDFYENWESEEGFTRCDFCKYIDRDSYDNDFIGFEVTKKGVSSLINILPGDDLKIASLLSIIEKDIKEPNAILYYGEENLNTKKFEKTPFKGLIYLGEFDWK